MTEIGWVPLIRGVIEGQARFYDRLQKGFGAIRLRLASFERHDREGRAVLLVVVVEWEVPPRAIFFL